MEGNFTQQVRCIIAEQVPTYFGTSVCTSRYQLYISGCLPLGDSAYPRYYKSYALVDQYPDRNQVLVQLEFTSVCITFQTVSQPDTIKNFSLLADRSHLTPKRLSRDHWSAGATRLIIYLCIRIFCLLRASTPSYSTVITAQTR